MIENRKKMTVNIPPSLLRDLKIESVNHDATFSDMLASYIRDFIGNGIYDMQERIKKYQHAGDFVRRGRPSTEFIEKNGPILNKKATFYFSDSYYRTIRKSARMTGLTLSAFVTLSLVYKKKNSGN